MLRIILLNYKRPNNVKAICDTLSKNFKITVVNNNPNVSFSHDKVDVINNTKNK